MFFLLINISSNRLREKVDTYRAEIGERRKEISLLLQTIETVYMKRLTGCHLACSLKQNEAPSVCAKSANKDTKAWLFDWQSFFKDSACSPFRAWLSDSVILKAWPSHSTIL